MLISICCSLLSFGQNKPTPAITIHYTRSPANVFMPGKALGIGYDGHEKGDNDKILRNVQQMFSANMKPLTYRLRDGVRNGSLALEP